MPRFFLSLAAFFGFSGVTLGAFGAHKLQNLLTEKDLSIFETAVRYQMYHALALFMLGLLVQRDNRQMIRFAGIAFIFGIMIFSGSLYALVLTQIRSLGAITPIGGVGLILGWAFLFFGILKQKS